MENRTRTIKTAGRFELRFVDGPQRISGVRNAATCPKNMGRFETGTRVRYGGYQIFLDGKADSGVFTSRSDAENSFAVAVEIGP